MRKGVSQTFLAIVLVVIVVGVGAAAFMLRGGESGNVGKSTGSNQSSTTSSGCCMGEANLEGHWQGTYQGSHGSGTWEWMIKRSGNTYIGCLRTTGTYNTGDSWIGVVVQADGNRITVGATAGGGVTFTGTVNGGQASGQWTMSGVDSGSWSGSRIGSAETLPCIQGGGSTYTSPGPGSSSTTTTSHQGTQTSGSELYIYPPTGTDHRQVALNVSYTILNYLDLNGTADKTRDSPIPGNDVWVINWTYPTSHYNITADGYLRGLYDMLVDYFQRYGYMIVPGTIPPEQYSPSMGLWQFAAIHPSTQRVVSILILVNQTSTTVAVVSGSPG